MDRSWIDPGSMQDIILYNMVSLNPIDSSETHSFRENQFRLAQNVCVQDLNTTYSLSDNCGPKSPNNSFSFWKLRHMLTRYVLRF